MLLTSAILELLHRQKSTQDLRSRIHSILDSSFEVDEKSKVRCNQVQAVILERLGEKYSPNLSRLVAKMLRERGARVTTIHGRRYWRVKGKGC